MGNTYSTDCLHAKTGRRVRSRVTTRVPSTKDVVAYAQCRRSVPAWSQPVIQHSKRCKDKGKRSTTRQVFKKEVVVARGGRSCGMRFMMAGWQA